jgi:hypothetical protein
MLFLYNRKVDNEESSGPLAIQALIFGHCLVCVFQKTAIPNAMLFANRTAEVDLQPSHMGMAEISFRCHSSRTAYWEQDCGDITGTTLRGQYTQNPANG